MIWQEVNGTHTGIPLQCSESDQRVSREGEQRGFPSSILPFTTLPKHSPWSWFFHAMSNLQPIRGFTWTYDYVWSMPDWQEWPWTVWSFFLMGMKILCLSDMSVREDLELCFPRFWVALWLGTFSNTWHPAHLIVASFPAVRAATQSVVNTGYWILSQDIDAWISVFSHLPVGILSLKHSELESLSKP